VTIFKLNGLFDDARAKFYLIEIILQKPIDQTFVVLSKNLIPSKFEFCCCAMYVQRPTL